MNNNYIENLANKLGCDHEILEGIDAFLEANNIDIENVNIEYDDGTETYTVGGVEFDIINDIGLKEKVIYELNVDNSTEFINYDKMADDVMKSENFKVEDYMKSYGDVIKVNGYYVACPVEISQIKVNEFNILNYSELIQTEYGDFLNLGNDQFAVIKDYKDNFDDFMNDKIDVAEINKIEVIATGTIEELSKAYLDNSFKLNDSFNAILINKYGEFDKFPEELKTGIIDNLKENFLDDYDRDYISKFINEDSQEFVENDYLEYIKDMLRNDNPTLDEDELSDLAQDEFDKDEAYKGFYDGNDKDFIIDCIDFEAMAKDIVEKNLDTNIEPSKNNVVFEKTSSLDERLAKISAMRNENNNSSKEIKIKDDLEK